MRGLVFSLELFYFIFCIFSLLFTFPVKLDSRPRPKLVGRATPLPSKNWGQISV